MSERLSSPTEHDTPTTIEAGASGVASLGAVAFPDAGTELGRYVVLETLGSGGMGVVLRAYDQRLEREVALKRLRSDVLEPRAAERLVREAQAMAQLAHPNVVGVYDVERLETTVLLVMELVRGRTLGRWIRDEQPPWPRILDVFIQAGRGLAAAHAAGLVHRDFKPPNVLVGDDGRVRVTDFGLARPVGAMGERLSADDLPSSSSHSLRVLVTAAGTVMGTPAYMAPEQHVGEDADAHADQYAFCVALWGSRPRDSNTAKLHAFSCKRLGSRGFWGVCDASGVPWGLGSSAVRQETVWRRAERSRPVASGGASAIAVAQGRSTGSSGTARTSQRPTRVANDAACTGGRGIVPALSVTSPL